MDPVARHELVTRLFQRAVELPEDARERFLGDACGADAPLCDAVRRLLRADERKSLEVEAVVGSAAAAVHHVVEGPGTQIGPYRLVRRLGEGGFGAVFLAEQHAPVARQVALKIIKLGMDTHQVIARFEAERQALALMDHPGIARVLDAGSTAAGRPYFVMELVHGEPITTYCDQQRLRVPERLDLFTQTCNAIQHAHQKGIIHRDIKPSNVLVAQVDGRPTVKVIDFGIAKALHQPLSDHTLTIVRQLVGTPQYMSPEQAESRIDIDTRSDIYSLGVLLYELLTGTTPFDAERLRAAALGEFQRVIREVEPEKPSTRVGARVRPASTSRTATVTGRAVSPGNDPSGSASRWLHAASPDGRVHDVATLRRTDPRTLRRRLAGDLDWIVMKCLEKDRNRRYETANSLARDLDCHLRHEPVAAGPPSVAYRFGKFVRRNRGLVIASALVATALVTGVAGTTWAMLWALRERDSANAARRGGELAERRANVTLALVTKSLAGANPFEGGHAGLLVTDAMEKVITRLDAGELDGDPGTEAELRLTIASIVSLNGRPTEALALAERALEINRTLHGGDHREVARSLHGVGSCLEMLGRPLEALERHSEALAMLRRLAGGDDLAVSVSLGSVAECLQALGRLAEAEAAFEQSLAMRQRMLAADHEDVAHALHDLAYCLFLMGRSQEALAREQQALEIYQRRYRGDHPAIAFCLNGQGLCLGSLGRAEEALAKYEAALGIVGRILKSDKHFHARILGNLADCLDALGRTAEALPKYELALSLSQSVHPGDHPDVARDRHNFGYCLLLLGRATEALPHLQSGLEMNRRLFTGDHPWVAHSLYGVAQCLDSLGRAVEALQHNEEALAMRRRLFDGDHLELARSLGNTGHCLLALNRTEQALPLYREAVGMLERLFAGDHPDLATQVANLGTCLQLLGRPEEALPRFEESLAMSQRLSKGDHPGIAAQLGSLAGCLNALGRYSEALPVFEAALGMWRRLSVEDHPTVAGTLNNQAFCLQALGRLDEAYAGFAAALEMRKRLTQGDHPDTTLAMMNAAECLELMGRDGDALPLFEAALTMRQRLFDPDHPSVLVSLQGSVRCLQRLGRWSEVEQKSVECLRIVRGQELPDAETLSASLAVLGSSLINQHKHTDAEPVLRECVALRCEIYPLDHPDAWLRFNALSLLGEALLAKADICSAPHRPEAGLHRASSAPDLGARLAALSEAEPLLIGGCEGLIARATAIPATHRQTRIAESAARVARLYELWNELEPNTGKDERAAEWRARLAEMQPTTSAGAPDAP